MPSMKFAQRLVVGRRTACQIAKAQILTDALLEFARRAHVDAKTVEPHFQHQSRIVGPLTTSIFVLVFEAAQIDRLHYLMHKETEMIGAQHIFHVGGQQLGLVGRIRLIIWHVHSCQKPHTDFKC